MEHRRPPERTPSTTVGTVFISYAAEDATLAVRVASYLSSQGWSVWWDRQIPVGMAYDEVIAEALRRADCAVVLWTQASVASRWVRAEASDAARRQILLPVLAEDVEIPLEFRLLHALDFRNTTGADQIPALYALHLAIARVCTSKPPETRHGAPAVGDALHTSSRFPRARSLVAALALAAALAAAWYWDAYHREVADHYAGVTTRWGLPEGIGPLSEDMVSRRNWSVVVIRSGRRNPAHEVRLVDGSGRVPPMGLAIGSTAMIALNPVPSRRMEVEEASASDLAQLTRVTFTRDRDGHLLEQVGFGRGGRRLYTLHFTAPNLGEYTADGFGLTIRESGVRYLRYSRVSKGQHAGLTERVEFLDDNRRLVANEDGNYGQRFVLNDAGFVREVVNLGIDGADHVNALGVLKEVLARDVRGNVVESTTVDDSNAPVVSRFGSAVVRLRYDRVGNQTAVSWLDGKNQPVVVAALGAAGYDSTYDGSGRVTSVSLRGPDQAPIVGAGGFAMQTFEWKAARQALIRSSGLEGRAIRGLDGALQALVDWDASGLVVETRLLDRSGNPVRGDSGCATRRMRYDGTGNVSEMTCLNGQGGPTLSSEGLTRVVFTSDARGNRLSTAFFDLSGQPGRVGERYAVIRSTYNASGSLVREAFFDPRGRPVRNREGFAVATFDYDAAGNRIRTHFLDEVGHRTTLVGGYSAIRSTFNERRLEISTTYLNANDRPVSGPDGYATVRYEYDPRGFVERMSYWGTGEQPVRNRDGYTSTRISWNQAGQVLARSYYDEQGQPTVAARLGYARRQWTYRAGRLEERSDHDVQGRATTNALGYSVVTYQYDEDGMEVSRTLHDSRRTRLLMAVGVDRATPGSQAADVGFLPGDLLLAYDGQRIVSSVHFANVLERDGSDRPREIRVERGGRTLDLHAPPGRLDGLEVVERALPAGTVPAPE